MKPKTWIALGAATIFAIPLCLLLVVTTIVASQASASCVVYSAAVPADIQLSGTGGLTSEQLTNARIIVGIASSRQLSVRDAKIALMVAMQESRLYNIAYGTGDSLGLFQQRPSQGWGTPEQIMDPIYSTNKFYDALEGVADRDNMSLLEVALAVQHPNRLAYLATFNSWGPIADSLLSGVSFSAPGTTTSTTTTESQTSTGAAATQTNSSSDTGFDTPCSSTETGVPGKVIIAPGANSPGQPITPVTLAFLAKVAGIYGKELICTTGTNHSYLTVDGTVSDHASGHACDFGMAANGGTDDGPVGDAIATACLIAAGDPPSVAASEATAGGLFTREHDGLRIQCIWKTDEGGNHHNHVHIGAAPQ